LWLATTLRLRAQLESPVNRADAETMAGRAFELGEKLINDGRATNGDVSECALASVTRGNLALQAGDRAAAQRHWERATDVLASRLADSRDWRLLDPAARAAAALGRHDAARAWVTQLDRYGYVPLDPWPPAIQLK